MRTQGPAQPCHAATSAEAEQMAVMLQEFRGGFLAFVPGVSYDVPKGPAWRAALSEIAVGHILLTVMQSGVGSLPDVTLIGCILHLLDLCLSCSDPCIT